MKVLQESLDYSPDTGIFIWKRNIGRKIKAAQVAGTKSDRGYIVIGLDGKKYRAHRLAWFFVYGSWPSFEIDHKNGIRDDNKILNLRAANPSKNGANKMVLRNGLKGVFFNKKRGRWIARISKDSRYIHIGCFNTEIEGHNAYMMAAVELHGEFARAA